MDLQRFLHGWSTYPHVRYFPWEAEAWIFGLIEETTYGFHNPLFLRLYLLGKGTLHGGPGWLAMISSPRFHRISEAWLPWKSCPWVNDVVEHRSRHLIGDLEFSGRLGGFQKEVFLPPKWIVKIMQNPIWNGRFGGTPIFGNIQMELNRFTVWWSWGRFHSWPWLIWLVHDGILSFMASYIYI